MRQGFRSKICFRVSCFGGHLGQWDFGWKWFAPGAFWFERLLGLKFNAFVSHSLALVIAKSCVMGGGRILGGSGLLLGLSALRKHGV